MCTYGQDKISRHSLSQIRTIDHTDDHTDGSAFDSEPNTENLNLVFMAIELEQDMVLAMANDKLSVWITKNCMMRLMEKHHLIQVMMKSGSTHQKGNLEDNVLNHLSMENDSLEEHQLGTRIMNIPH